MAGSETLEIIVDLKGSGLDGLKKLQQEIHAAAGEAKGPGTESLKKLSAEIQAVGTSAAGASEKVSGLGKAAITISSALKTLGTILSVKAVFDWIGQAISDFSELDDILRKTAAISGATGEEFRQMGELADEMGIKTAFSGKLAAQTLLSLVQAGMSAANAMKALPAVMTLAQAGVMGLNDAVQTSTTIMNTFGLSVEQLPSLNNVLIRAMKDTGTSVKEMTSSLETIGPLAHSVGADFEDLVGTIGRMHKGGVQATTAATALRTVLSGLLNPTAAEEKLMDQLSKRIGGAGLQLKDANGRFIGFLSVVKQLEAAHVTSGEAIRLFGERAGPAMAALLNQGSAALEKTINYVRQLDDEAQKTADEAEKGLGGAFRALGSSSEAVRSAFGAVFGEDIRILVVRFGDELLKLVKYLKELKENGTLSGWAEDVKAAFTSIGALIDFAILGPIKLVTAGLIELSNTARGAAAVVRGDLSFKDFALATAGELNEMLRPLSDNPAVARFRIQLKEVEKEITATKSRMANLEAARGTSVLDTDALLEKEQKTLTELEGKWKDLGVAITDYGKEVKKVGEQPGPAGQRSDFAGEQTVQPLENIGRAGVTNVPKPTLETDSQKKARDAALKAEIADYTARQKEYMAIVNQIRQTGLILYEKDVAERINVTNKFYEEQKTSIQNSSDFEIAALQKLAAREKSGSAERIQIESDILTKRRETAAQLIDLETKRLEEEYRLNVEAKQKREDLDNKAADIKLRMTVAQVESPVERQFTEERLRLDEKHRLEMEALKKLTDDKAMLQDLANTQELEKQRQHEDQVMALRMMQYDAAKQVFGGIDDLMTAMYEASGKKVKAFFYVAKAAAIAEAIVNVAQGITKAFAQGGYYGYITGAAVAAAGAVQIAKISSQQLAVGGLVRGTSPTSSADDKLIAATSGEYMQPVAAVRTYGVEFMNSVRNLRFPRDLASRFSSSYPMESTSRRSFAAGGLIGGGGAATPDKEAQKGITINNILDPQVFSKYLASAPGERQLLNVISNNQFAVKQILFSNG